jgi:3-deoxy-D-manno-octulosonic-acid transferase
VHAVSVGETRAAVPLIRALASSRPQASFVLTHMTPTGRAAGAELLPELEGRLQQRYLPYDVPFAIARFLNEVQPTLGVLMETEIWPNLLQATRARGIPVVLANARLSEKSLRRGQAQASLMRAAVTGISAVAAQTQADAQRIAQLYDGPIHVSGNLKFDVLPSEALLEQGRRWRARWIDAFGDRFAHRPIWLFASSREGEEAIFLDAWRTWSRTVQSASTKPRPVLLVVPRHPQRFDEVARLLAAAGPVVRRSQWEHYLATVTSDVSGPVARVGAGPDILLGDSMGEMPLYYAMADVALMGGSLLSLGGQNLIEACACGCPVVMGPHMFNFAQAAADAEAAGAAVAVRDPASALLALAQISRDVEQQLRMAQAARSFAAQHRGATERTLTIIDGAVAPVAAATIPVPSQPSASDPAP